MSTDALANLRTFIATKANVDDVAALGGLVDALEKAIDARVTELLEANNREVERRRVLTQVIDAAETERQRLVAAAFTMRQFAADANLAGCTTGFGVFMRRDDACRFVKLIIDKTKAVTATDIDVSKLPCDVHLPPNTYIRKGVDVATLMTAIRQREGRPDGDTTFPRYRAEIPAFLAKIVDPSQSTSGAACLCLPGVRNPACPAYFHFDQRLGEKRP